MSFSTGYLADPALVDGGELVGNYSAASSYTTFEDGLAVGRFAKLDAGSLDNLDASASPVIAGVVLRQKGAAVEQGDTFQTAEINQVEACEAGLVTVEVKAGDTPSKFDPVGAYNVADAEVGKATTTTTVPVDAVFYREVKAGVWVIRLK